MSENERPAQPKTTTLTEDDIVTSPRMSRRSSLGLLGGALGAAVTAVAGLRSSTAQAQDRRMGDQQGPTDNDPPPPNGDVAGRGRTGFSDRDSGPNEDMPGHGVCPLRGHTDQDAPPNDDPAGRGQGPCHR